MTPNHLIELAREALKDDKRATPGPWTPSANPQRWVEINVVQEQVIANRDADAAFVAATRTREPLLAAEVLRLTDALAVMTTARDEACRLLEGTIKELEEYEEDPGMLNGHKELIAELRAVGKK